MQRDIYACGRICERFTWNCVFRSPTARLRFGSVHDTFKYYRATYYKVWKKKSLENYLPFNWLELFSMRFTWWLRLSSSSTIRTKFYVHIHIQMNPQIRSGQVKSGGKITKLHTDIHNVCKINFCYDVMHYNHVTACATAHHSAVFSWHARTDLGGWVQMRTKSKRSVDSNPQVSEPSGMKKPWHCHI